MSILGARLLVGCLLLLLGRRFFWLFVAAVGFILGMQFAQRFLPASSDQTVILFSLAVGVVGAVLALALKRVALGVAGFFAGGYLLLRLAELSGGQFNVAPWLAFLVGGVLGALLIGTVFNWSLIVLSSLAGATLIAENLSLQPPLEKYAFIGLCILGILVQAGLLRNPRRLDAS